MSALCRRFEVGSPASAPVAGSPVRAIVPRLDCSREESFIGGWGLVHLHGLWLGEGRQQLARLALGVVAAGCARRRRAVLSGGRADVGGARVRTRGAAAVARRRLADRGSRAVVPPVHGPVSLLGNCARPGGVTTVFATRSELPCDASSSSPFYSSRSPLPPPLRGRRSCRSQRAAATAAAPSKDAGLLHAMTDVGPPTDAPAQPAGFYRLDITVGDGEEITGHDRLSWVPSAGMLLTRDGTWLAVRPEVRSGLDEPRAASPRSRPAVLMASRQGRPARNRRRGRPRARRRPRGAIRRSGSWPSPRRCC